MKTLSRFITRFTSLIVAVLSCFDRVIFKGHLALAAPCELELQEPSWVNSPAITSIVERGGREYDLGAEESSEPPDPAGLAGSPPVDDTVNGDHRRRSKSESHGLRERVHWTQTRKRLRVSVGSTEAR
jgi:hypothetical protein